MRGTGEFFLQNAEVKQIRFVALPHNPDGEVDLHRPYIDAVTFKSSKGTLMKRIPEVFDCWFESGSMPYAENHYPFENTDIFNPKRSWFKKSKRFPADFIAEGLDQTRGWFYSMLVLGVALFDRSPFKNVVVNGLVLAEDGQKMSKSKQNYPDPMDIVDKYGVDALRFNLLSSPVVRAQDLRFSEKSVDEVVKKHITRLQNVYSFYELYAPKNDNTTQQKNLVEVSPNVLDQWIIARLDEVRAQVTDAMESYELDRALRPFPQFIDDLSTWYLRRSRDRFKGTHETDKHHALNTTRKVIEITSRLLAPFMPFLAEDLYQKVRGAHDPISVHLTSWPTEKDIVFKKTKDLIEMMQKTRTFVTLALEHRAKANIKVRQPLASVTIKTQGTLTPEFSSLIQDEVNVKKVFVETISGADEITLDTTLTDSLKQEGVARDLIRAIQEYRKELNLSIHDVVSLQIHTNPETAKIIDAWREEIKNVAGLSDVITKPLTEHTSKTGHKELVIEGVTSLLEVVKR